MIKLMINEIDMEQIMLDAKPNNKLISILKLNKYRKIR